MPYAAPTGSVAVEGDAVWAVFGDSTLARIRPDGSRVVGTTLTGDSSAAVVVGDGAVWVANEGDATVQRFNPATFGEGPTRDDHASAAGPLRSRTARAQSGSQTRPTTRSHASTRARTPMSSRSGSATSPSRSPWAAAASGWRTPVTARSRASTRRPTTSCRRSRSARRRVASPSAEGASGSRFRRPDYCFRQTAPSSNGRVTQPTRPRRASRR